MKKTLTTTLALALTATIALAQAPAPKPATPAAAPAAADPVIITAGTLTIHQSEFEAAIKTLPAEYQGYAMGPGKKQFAEDFLRMKLLAAEGMKNGLDKSPEVNQQLSLMRENLVANSQLKKIESGIVISDEDLKKAFQGAKANPEQVTARHILIAFKGSRAAQPGKKELTEDEAKAKAEDLRKQILAGADFAELAKKESDDTGSGSRGGELGSFGKGQMVPEFEQAAFAAKPGEVTAPVRTEYGYHIIKVEEPSFDDAKAGLEKAERAKRLTAAIDALKSGANAVFADAYFPPPPAAPKVEEAAPATAASPAVKPADTKKPATKKPEPKKP